MPQMGVDVPDEVMVALSERRISLLLDHQAGQLVQPGQTAAAIMMSTEKFLRTFANFLELSRTLANPCSIRVWAMLSGPSPQEASYLHLEALGQTP